MERLHPAMLKQMRECGIAVEVQDTVRKVHVEHLSEGEGGGHGDKAGGCAPCVEGLCLLPEGCSFPAF